MQFDIKIRVLLSNNHFEKKENMSVTV